MSKSKKKELEPNNSTGGIDVVDALVTVILSFLAIGGFLTLFFCRNLIDFSINTTNCATFPLAMITFGKWLIIPAGIMGIASAALIPTVLAQNDKLTRIILYILAAVILGLVIYLYFFKNDFTMPDGVFNKIVKIFSIILVLLFVLIAIFLMLAAIYSFGEGEIGTGILYTVIVILIPFLQCLSSFLQTLDGFWWGLLAIIIQIVPLFFIARFVVIRAFDAIF